MIRTMNIKPVLAALALTLVSSAAFAQPVGSATGNANDSPAQLSGAQPDNRYPGDSRYDDNRDMRVPSADRSAGRTPPNQQTAEEQRSRDLFCRRDAAARTGYTSPGDAARREQTNGTIGGTLGGAALGAIIGSASGNAGTGAAIGAGAGLLAGTAVGASNARNAARDVEARYGEAYYACMDQADDREGDFAADAPRRPPPRVYYDAAPYPYYYPRPYYYGPSVSFGFGFGGGYGRGWGGHRGFGGWHHR